MRRGTTPTHNFVLPFSVDMISAVEISYAQHEAVKLTKTKADCALDGKTVSVTLTQEDTFIFAEDVPVEIQIRVLTTGGQALASDIYSVSCKECLSDGVLK